MRELARSESVGRYRLRESQLWIHLRHGSPDVFALDQAFYQRLYEPPETVRRRLEGLGRPLKAVDLGGNIGTFGLHLLGRYRDAAVTSFEPDPKNAQLLAATVDANAIASQWRLVAACAATEDGTARFAAGQFGVSRIDADGELTVPAVDVFPYLRHADLIKIDIEGSEWPLLLDPRFSELDAAAIHLEYHERLAPDEDPAAFAARLLEGAGYSIESDREGALWALRN